jgi:O-antigen/teichoic acid export membrane protein
MKESMANDAKLVALGSLVSSLSTYVFLIVAARALGVEGFGEFSVFWGAFFLLAGLIGAIDLEAARQVANDDDSSARTQKSLILAAGVIGLIATLVWILISSLSLDADPGILAIGVVGIWLVVPLGITRGSLIGAKFSSSYSKIIAGEGIIRLFLAVLVFSTKSNSVLQFAALTVAGMAIWIPWFKHVLPTKSEILFSESFKNLTTLLVASAGSAILLSGLPWIMSLNQSVSSEQLGILASGLILSRIPILAFSSIQALLIPYFVRGKKSQSTKSAISNLGTSLVFLIISTSLLLASVFGPRLLRIFFGDGFVIESATFTILFASSWVLVAHMVLVSKLIANNSHMKAAASWLIGAVMGSLMISNWATSVNQISLYVLTASTMCLVFSFAFSKFDDKNQTNKESK